MIGEVEELSPSSFIERWPAEQRGEVQLLDVREHDELAHASLPGTVHIPMQEVPARLVELDPRRPIVVMCHSGYRSRNVAAFLLANGFEQVYNLAGGIRAWSIELGTD